MHESCWGFYLRHVIFVTGCQKLAFGPLGFYDEAFLGICSYEGVELPSCLQAAKRQIFLILFACCDVGPENELYRKTTCTITTREITTSYCYWLQATFEAIN